MKKAVASVAILLVLVFSTSVTAWGVNSKVGTTAYGFLKIDPGARSTAMGGAFVGLSDDAAALYFNPAGLILTDTKHFFATYNNYLTDIQSGFLGYIHPYSEDTRLGISVSYFNYGSFDKTDDLGQNLGTFGASDFAVALSAAKTVKSQFNVGVTGKFIYEKLDEFSSDALAFDVGFLYLLRDGRTQIGAAGQNIGTQLKGATESHKDPLPTSVKLGISHRMRELPLTIALDAAKPVDNDIFFSLGGEFTALQPLYLRLGWSSFGENYKTDSDKDNLAGFAAGFGVTWKVYHFDYAFSSYADLGGVHKISISGEI
jgi:hypothetical protein